MEISTAWLADFVSPPAINDLCDLLLHAGVEVESINDIGSRIDDVVVGRVVACEAHPEANKLKVCQVSDGDQTHQVVCGAPNVAQDQLVAFARIGGRVGDVHIASRTIRGESSAGMLCSRFELGLGAQNDGIWILPSTLRLGESIIVAMGLQPTLTLGVTPNRPDLLCHLGVAREVAAATGQRVNQGSWHLTENGAAIDHRARVVVMEPTCCPRYVAHIVDGLALGPSPAWLADRLESIGQRLVNNVVDVTNYVLFELGQPTHAFDLNTLATQNGMPTIYVRKATTGETLTTLDGNEYTLDPNDLLIADANRPLALAGIMGGKDSEVTGTTTQVLLESAFFEGTGIRRTARRHGLHTESSHRFERGADPLMPSYAAKRCAQLLTKIAGGQACKGALEIAQRNDAPIEINLRPAQIPRVLGISLSADKIVSLLDPLQIRCTASNDHHLHFEVPSFRPDLKREVDLIEETARRYGFDRIPETLPDTSGPYRYTAQPRATLETTRRALLTAGCDEAVTYGFGSPSVYGKQAIRIKNPLGEELSALRTSLLPGLFEALGKNQRHGQKSVRLFETGTTFHAPCIDANKNTNTDARDRDLPQEMQQVGVILFGGRHDGRWYENEAQCDFSDLTGVLETLIDAFECAEPLRLKAFEVEGFNPYCSAQVMMGETVIGVAGQVHPRKLRNQNIAGPVFVAEINLDDLEHCVQRSLIYHAFGKFPAIRRDLAIECDDILPAATVEDFLRNAAGGDLGAAGVASVHLFDVYRGRGVPKGRVSLAFAILYRLKERTLTDDEVTAAFDGAKAALVKQWGVAIR